MGVGRPALPRRPGLGALAAIHLASPAPLPAAFGFVDRAHIIFPMMIGMFTFHSSTIAECLCADPDAKASKMDLHSQSSVFAMSLE